MKTLKKYPLTWLCIVTIWVLCLLKPPSNMPNLGMGADKWAHFLMYLGTCSVMWIEYFRIHLRSQRLRVFVFAIALPIAMSGMIELAQAYLTENRSGDWYDFAANTIGVLLAAVGAFAWRKIKQTKQ